MLRASTQCPSPPPTQEREAQEERLTQGRERGPKRKRVGWQGTADVDVPLFSLGWPEQGHGDRSPRRPAAPILGSNAAHLPVRAMENTDATPIGRVSPSSEWSRSSVRPRLPHSQPTVGDAAMCTRATASDEPSDARTLQRLTRTKTRESRSRGRRGSC